MRYQIVHMIPRYNDYDAVCGWSYHRQPNAYETLALASKIAACEWEIDAYVIPYGGDVIRDSIHPCFLPPVADTIGPMFDCEIPF